MRIQLQPVVATRRPRAGRFTAGVVALLVTVLGTTGLAACGGNSKPTGSVSASSASGSNPASGSASASGSGSGNTVLGKPYSNPVSDQDFPDPAVISAGGRYYAYGTQGGGSNIQVLTSPDLTTWTPAPDALPEVGPWASTGSTWAPEVLALAGKYVMFYVAHDNKSGKQCIGRAESATPGGPFTDKGSTAVICQAELGGSIDPNPVRAANGALYLYWKNDGNCCDKPVRLWVQRLSPDAAGVQGSPVALLSNTRDWQGNLIEAPEMVSHAGRYFLFYSANDYASDKYAVGYASCQGPTGPCTDRSSAPLLASDGAAAGPGHCYVLNLSDGTSVMLFHAWQPSAIGSSSPGRQLWLEPLTWRNGLPSVHQPS